jgi:hypothetical protein
MIEHVCKSCCSVKFCLMFQTIWCYCAVILKIFQNSVHNVPLITRNIIYLKLFAKGPFGSLELNQFPENWIGWNWICRKVIQFQFSCLAIHRIDFLELNSKCCLDTFIWNHWMSSHRKILESHRHKTRQHTQTEDLKAINITA